MWPSAVLKTVRYGEHLADGARIHLKGKALQREVVGHQLLDFVIWRDSHHAVFFHFKACREVVAKKQVIQRDVECVFEVKVVGYLVAVHIGELARNALFEEIHAVGVETIGDQMRSFLHLARHKQLVSLFGQ